MRINNLSAAGFRNLEISGQRLYDGLNILTGDNAQGKTSFLEAVYFCALGRAIRTRSDGELVRWGSQTAHVRLDMERAGITVTIDAFLEIQGRKTAKSISVDKIPVRHIKDLYGRMLVVTFSPEDLKLVKAGPSERRRFIDIELCQLSSVYYNDLKEYHRALKQRNILLKTLQKSRANYDSLFVWDEQLAGYGERIMKTRSEFVKRMSEAASEIHGNITQGAEKLTLTYSPGFASLDIIGKTHERDIARGSTLEGVHTDDIEFTLNGVSARHFGSQGQQRTSALSAKLAEISIIEKSTGEHPVLLLDDVLSELDNHRQRFLFKQIENLQTILTCTGIEDAVSAAGSLNIMRMENGKIVNEG